MQNRNGLMCDVMGNTWKCGELKLYFSPIHRGIKRRKEEKIGGLLFFSATILG